jgi:1-acyl-sn-glycerol-3-phosphate acyltransferase
VFYRLLKIYSRIVIRIYCRRIFINRPEVLTIKGPLLLAANHPNSFLDGVLLTTLFDDPVYSLARGDVFKHKRIDRILRNLQLLPIFRTSEGVKNLGHNYTTFDACQKTFEKDGIILIFSEGSCENEWHLRPLKKGTARLALTAWKKNVPLVVLPTGINYSSFKKFGKEVHIYFGEQIHAIQTTSEDINGKEINDFNEQLEHELKKLVYETAPNDEVRKQALFKTNSTSINILLFIPAVIGYLLHAPLFLLCKLFTDLRFKHSGHYDSVLHSLLILFYPFYLLLIFFILLITLNWLIALSIFVVLPFSAWCWVQMH